MVTLKDLIQRQGVLVKELTSHFSNYSKESQDRRNNPDRVASWIPRINQDWGEFRRNHDELAQYSNSELVKKYLIDVNFKAIDEEALKTVRAINSRLVSLGREERNLNEMLAEMASKKVDAAGTSNESVQFIQVSPTKTPSVPATTSVGQNSATKDGSTSQLPQAQEQLPSTEPISTNRNGPNGNSTRIDDVMNDLESSDRDFIQRFVVKERLFENRLKTMEDLIDREDLEAAHAMITHMKDKWSEIVDELESVCMIVSTSGSYIEVFNDIEKRYVKLLSLLGRNPQHFRDVVEPAPLKLKPIQIQQFTGDWRTWPTFSELFRALVIENRSLNDAQKMQYLKTNLSGAALKLIQRPNVAGNEHFHVAWKILQNRYENKRAIMNMSIDGLVDQANMTTNCPEQMQRLLDNSREFMAMLKGVTAEQCILRILCKKLDETSLEKYESTIANPKEPQDLENFFEFLEQRAQVLQTLKMEKHSSKSNAERKQRQACECCGERHALFMCFSFKKMSINDRQKLVKSKELCVLCLKAGHSSQSCVTTLKCKQCEKRHNTLLHFTGETSTGKASPNASNVKAQGKTPHKKSFVCVADESEEETVSCVAANQNRGSRVLLATAQIRIKTAAGWSEEICALIDQGSMATFITENIVKQLNLKRIKNDVSVSGIGGIKTEKSLGSVDIEFTARYPTKFSSKTRAIVLGKLTALSPVTHARAKVEQCNEFNELVLADPNLNKAVKIDVILGVDVFAAILMHGVIKAESLEVVAQETQLGWILSGVIEGKAQNVANMVSLVTTIDELNESMKRFWEIEEIGGENMLSEEEKYCITHYEENTARDEEGRYVVAIPFRENITDLGNSRRGALAQLLHQERRFAREPELREQYAAFMREYIAMGHMVECEDVEIENGYYLPHHAVFKDSTTTKLRVVFDASRKTSTGISLNDCMMVGPKVQDDLFNIVLRFRLRRIAFTADIAKMYRQIWIREDQQNYQRILWREHRSENIKEYRLKTVTYGTCTAPYMAVQTIVTQAKVWEFRRPRASKIIQRDFYMDDLMSSADNNTDAIELQQQITQILAEAGMQLRKWSTNSLELLNAIPVEHQEGAQKDGEASIATLGLRWFNISDEFGFKMNPFKDVKVLTKRVILSEITKIYDPLGLIAPFTILCKVLMQKLWVAALEWDSPVPNEIAAEWVSYKEQIPILLNFRIKRWVGYDSSAKIQLHGFSDASETAYGAQIYAKIIKKDRIYSNLIAVKTRVAPLSKQSIPRLELCAALLLAELMEKVSSALKVPIDEKYYYSDSKIALAWIDGSSRRWETYVGNRVAKIQKLSDRQKWRYVNTKENPADIASRGMVPEELVQSELWWYGPQWLRTKSNGPESGDETFSTTLGLKKILVAMNLVHDEEIISRFSSLNKAIRTIAYCHRFGKITLKKSYAEEPRKSHGLEVEELEHAKMSLIRLCQSTYFEAEIDHLRQHNEVNARSPLRSLYPFLDDRGILRVGGRLQNSDFEYNKKHPIILPYKGPFTRLVIDAAHRRMLHGGNQLTMMQIRHEFWIISCKRAVKAYINKCVKCHRFRATSATQLMGSLPGDRTRALVKPFTYSGTDFCGPFTMRMSSNTRTKTIKGYVAIFICFSTRAVHLEAVSDLTAEAFVAAFRRFISRRGNVLKLYSDNGGNFVKAKTILELETAQAIIEFNEEIKKELANLSTKFYFNPPAAPWFGGLWERNIGSIKHHYKRVIGDRILSYEEMTTTLAQIEACLNSRPLCAMNENPDDVTVLTPGHFLIGGAITAPVAPSVLDIKENRLSRWQLCERLKQEFWKKWSDDYISSLQARTKWQQREQNLKVGDLVLIKDEINPPLRWPLAKITQVFPGKDELVRVVEVTTGTKRYKRAIGRLSKLPIEDNESESNNKPSDEANNTIQSLFIQCHGTQRTKKRNTTKNVAFKWLVCMCIMILLSGLITTTYADKQYAIKNIETENGLFFEKGGKLEIASSSWNILTVINTRVYRTNLEALQENVYELEHLCNLKRTRRASIACESIAIELNRQMEKIKKYDSLINIEKRRKRTPAAMLLALGTGSAIGWAANKIGEYVFNNNKNTEQLESMIKDQTSVLALTEEVMRKSQEKWQTQMNLLINQTEEIYEQVDVLTRNAEIAERSQWVATHLIITLGEFNEFQKLMLELITDTDNKLKLTWIKVDALRSQIELIEKNLKENTQLSGNSMNEKIVNIYRLAKTRSGFIDDELVLSVEIPLIDNEEFEWYTIHNFPVKKDESYFWIKSTKKLFATNVNRTKYTFIQHERLEETNANNTLIRGKLTMFNFNSKWVHCEAKVFHEKEIDAEKCTITISKQREYWQQLTYDNSWLFTMPYDTVVNVKCDKQVANVTIKNTGILSLARNCIVSTESARLVSAGEASSHFLSELDTISIIKNDTTSVKINKTNFQKLMKLSEQVNTAELSQAIERLQIQQNNQLSYSYQFGNYVLIYGLFIFLFILMLVCRK